MSVFYSGWGYWQWEEQGPGENNELTYFARKEGPAKVCTFFELPEDSVKEITYLSTTTTNYLLPSRYTEGRYYPHIPYGVEFLELVFCLCEKWEYDHNKPFYEQDEPIDIFFTFKTEDVKEPPTDIKQLSLDSELPKPLTETERNTLLKLIIGMAIDAYGYDPISTRSSLTGGKKDSLSAKLQTHGININDDTIRKYLKEAKKLL